MARSRTNYNVDTTTKILDTHKQFMGGLKTVDTDDSVRDFFLRDAENLSLSEFGFVERRYGLVKDANYEQLVDVVNEVELPDSDDVFFKDRLQGYFEYTRKDKVKEIIVFYNGRLYLNGVLITTLYRYPSDFDPILGRFNTNITADDFAEYIDRVYPNISFNPEANFTSIGSLFNTGRSIDGVRIDDRMFFFTGVYPIVYEGTGEFYLLPEFVTNFEQLALFNHNLHTANLNRVYTSGFAPRPVTSDAIDLTTPAFGDTGYAPMYPYMVGTGSGLDIKVNYKLPPIAPYTSTNFQTFVDNEQITTQQYLELVPEIYYRPSGLSSTVSDETWTRVEQQNVQYQVLNNLILVAPGENEPLPTPQDVLAYESFKFPSFITPSRSFAGQPLYSATEKRFDIKILGLPSGLFDIQVVYRIYQAGYTTTDGFFQFEEKVLFESVEFIRNITFTKEKTTDYIRTELIDDQEVTVPVNDPAALWTCNRVLNHYGKLMAYGSLIHPERVFISHPTFIHYFPFFFTRDFETDERDAIQQITPFMNILVVQTESYSWGLKGIDAVLGAPNFYTPFVISPLYGTIAPNSVRPVRNQLFFLSRDGIVSLQSLYAIDEQYNVKHIDTNIENIVPLDPDAVAIQYDNQYWIHFPNTANFMTLRYHVDMKAWMKDTYFEYNGLDANNKPQLSLTVFNGVHKYLREDEKLVLITNPMKQLSSFDTTNDDENYRINRLYVDYTIATDLKELPRTLFETSFLDQSRPFNEKKYIEEKMEFTIQNEYHIGKEAIFRDEDLQMNDTPNINSYTMYDLPLQKNHDYQVVIPKQGLTPVTIDGNVLYPNQTADIKRINVRLFDILGREIDTLTFQPNTPPVPSIKNFLTFPATNEIEFSVFNNDIQVNKITYNLRSTLEEFSNFIRTGSFETVLPQKTQSIKLGDIPPGPLVLEIRSERPTITPSEVSEPRVLNFQMEDGVYDGFTAAPTVTAKSPLQLSAIPVDTRNGEVANRIVVTWVDQNPSSEGYRVRYRNKTSDSGILGSETVTVLTANIDFNDENAVARQGDTFEIFVQAIVNGELSLSATTDAILEVFTDIPTSVSSNSMTTQELFQNGTRLNFGWVDVNYESEYQLLWRYINEEFATDNDYPANRIITRPANSTLFTFFVGGNIQNQPQILPNSIIELKVNGVNANGFSANPGIRQGIFRTQYDPASFVIEPVNGVSGFKVTIPGALKVTPFGNPAGHVFETSWLVEYKRPSEINYTAVTIPSFGNNFFSVTGLNPSTVYEVKVRGRYTVNGNLFAVVNFPTTPVFEVTTGNDIQTPMVNPGIFDIQQAVDANNNRIVRFNLRNSDSRPAVIHYTITTNLSEPVNDNYPSISLLGSTTSAQLTSDILSNATTYVIRAIAYPGTEVVANPSEIVTGPQFTTPALVTATFNLDGGTMAGSSAPVSGYAPFSVSSPGTPIKGGETSTGWNPSLPRTISQNTTFTALYPATQPPPPAIPFGPQFVELVSNGSTSLTASWPSVSGATSYQIQFVRLGGAGVVSSATITTVSRTLTTSIAGDYQAFVAACSSSGCSSTVSSNVVTHAGSGGGGGGGGELIN